MTKAIPYVPYIGPIVTRAEAKAAGSSRYFTGQSCPRGHIAQRVTTTGTCVFCARAMMLAYHKANKEDHQRVFERQRRWLKKNKRHGWDYYAKNAERMKARRRQRYIENPDKFKTAARNREAKKAGAEGSHTTAELQTLLNKQRGKCAYCHKSIRTKRHADHIVALSEGGSNWISNIQLTCPTCNMRKGRTDAILFAARLGRLL